MQWVHDVLEIQLSQGSKQSLHIFEVVFVVCVYIIIVVEYWLAEQVLLQLPLFKNKFDTHCVQFVEFVQARQLVSHGLQEPSTSEYCPVGQGNIYEQVLFILRK